MQYSRKIEVLATFFYLGKSPFMPGTIGTLGAIPLVLLLHPLGPWGYMGITFLVILFSIWCSERYESMVQDHDRREVVIDEVVGYLMTMFWMPMTWQAFLFGFILFRALDIFKPFPISLIDHKVTGGFGTTLDDLVAGLIANLVMQFIYTQTNWLGVQWVAT
jgi:phosphatidylglycerophosphatase A